MKRIHLFEFEDQSWFPGWLRDCMTAYINAFHKILKSPATLADLQYDVIQKTGKRKILDLCSGGGWLTVEAARILREKHRVVDLEMEMTDLYPNREAARIINAKDDGISYRTEPVNAAAVGTAGDHIRTMNCSMHHMPPETARKILQDAERSGNPLVVFELTDNATPTALFWLAIPFIIITVLLLTPAIRPFTWKQFVFTYLIPILPLLIAWDGAVSNARTYTEADYMELLKETDTGKFRWETGTIKGRGGNRSYLVGIPVMEETTVSSLA